MKFEWDEEKNLINKEEQLREVEEAKKHPIVFDEDCPELSPAMRKAFQCSVVQRNRRKKA